MIGIVLMEALKETKVAVVTEFNAVLVPRDWTVASPSCWLTLVPQQRTRPFSNKAQVDEEALDWLIRIAGMVSEKVMNPRDVIPPRTIIV